MLTNHELMFGIGLPLVVAVVIGVIAWWSRRAWLLPLAGGLGFLTGYASSLGSTGGFGLPRLPPSDGTDWLFWAALPAIGLAMLVAWLGWRWLAIVGAWAGVVPWTVARPLVPGTLSAGVNLEIAAAAGVIGVVVVGVHTLVAGKIGHGWSVLSLCVVLGGRGRDGVVVESEDGGRVWHWRSGGCGRGRAIRPAAEGGAGSGATGGFDPVRAAGRRAILS